MEEEQDTNKKNKKANTKQQKGRRTSLTELTNAPAADSETLIAADRNDFSKINTPLKDLKNQTRGLERILKNEIKQKHKNLLKKEV